MAADSLDEEGSLRLLQHSSELGTGPIFQSSPVPMSGPGRVELRTRYARTGFPRTEHSVVHSVQFT